MIDTTKHTDHGTPQPSAFLLFIDTQSRAHLQRLPEYPANFLEASLPRWEKNEKTFDPEWILGALDVAFDDWMLQVWNDVPALQLTASRAQLLTQMLAAALDELGEVDKEITFFDFCLALRAAVQRVGAQLAEVTNA